MVWSVQRSRLRSKGLNLCGLQYTSENYSWNSRFPEGLAVSYVLCVEYKIVCVCTKSWMVIHKLINCTVFNL
jgi:hypothetical protein